ncbi:MAG: phosphodiesterase [Pseudomonadota bacterium]
MNKALLVGLALAAPLTLAPVVQADVLLVDEVRQVENMDLPTNGLSKAEVEMRFGAPDQRHSAVGEPPITRWDYETYSVYFEYDLVLFSVLTTGQPIDSA